MDNYNRDILTAEQIEREIGRLQLWLQVIKQEEMEERKRRSAVNVGRCFKTDDGRYVLIADVLEEVESPLGFHCHQFPGIWLNDEMVPIEQDLAFNGMWCDGYLGVRSAKYQEIKPEEFLEAFYARIQRLQDTVEQLIAEREEQS